MDALSVAFLGLFPAYLQCITQKLKHTCCRYSERFSWTSEAMDKLTSRSADSCIISGSDGVYMAQSRSLLTKCLIIAVWGKLTLYKYVACWLIAVSSHCLYLLFTTAVCVLSVLFFIRLVVGQQVPKRKPVRIIIASFHHTLLCWCSMPWPCICPSVIRR